MQMYRILAVASLALAAAAPAAAAEAISAVYTTTGASTHLVTANAPAGSGRAPFGWHISGATFNNVFDPVSYIGYNTNGAGGKVIDSEPLLTWNVEANYMQGPVPTMETYWEMRNTAGTRGVRPIFLQFNRETAQVQRFTFASDWFGFSKQPVGAFDDPEPWLYFYPGAIEIKGSSGAPAQLHLGTPPGKESVFAMTWGGKRALYVRTIRPNHVRITSGGGAQIELIGKSIHVGRSPVVLTSPNGKKWALSVRNDGTLQTRKR